jgi:hypothetical protein
LAHIAGKAGAVYGTTTGTTAAIIAGVKSWTLDYVVDALETTDFGDSGHRTYIPGLDGWSGKFEGFKDGAPIALGAWTLLELRESTNTTQKWTGTGIVTGIHPSVSVDGVVTYAYDYIGTGTLTLPTA